MELLVGPSFEPWACIMVVLRNRHVPCVYEMHELFQVFLQHHFYTFLYKLEMLPSTCHLLQHFADCIFCLDVLENLHVVNTFLYLSEIATVRGGFESKDVLLPLCRSFLEHFVYLKKCIHVKMTEIL